MIIIIMSVFLFYLWLLSEISIIYSIILEELTFSNKDSLFSANRIMYQTYLDHSLSEFKM